MRKNKLGKWLFLALILGSFFVPMQAFANYEFYDGFDTNDGSQYIFNDNWRATGAPDDPENPHYRGDWESIATPFPIIAQTFAHTGNNKDRTILYRIQEVGEDEDIKNYQVTATISAGDNDSLGIVFYYQDDDNYYRLTINNEKSGQPSYDDKYPHSIFLTRRADGIDELLAITPWPGTHHAVKPYSTIKLRIKVITDQSDDTDNNWYKYILAQYYNPSIGDYVNLFDEIYTDKDIRINYGWAGVYASFMEDESVPFHGGNLHDIDVKHITSINDIKPDNPPIGVRDPYLLDYRDDETGDGYGEEIVRLKHIQYTPAGTGKKMYWFLDDERLDVGPTEDKDIVTITIPVGKHFLYLYEKLDEENSDKPDEASLSGTKEVWVSSKSAFTIAIMPDLHAKQSTVEGLPNDYARNMRDYQIEGIMSEIRKRAIEDNIKAVIQVGDMAMRGTAIELETVSNYFGTFLPDDMPIIAAVGNHDYMGCVISSKPMDDRNSRFPDYYIFDDVTDENRVERAKDANRDKPGYGAETPNELDNMYFLFEDKYLGGPDSGSGNWLVLSLQTDPMTRDLFWAEKIIKRYNNYNVILVTHQFLDEYGNIDDNIVNWPSELIPPPCPFIPDTLFYPGTYQTYKFTGGNSAQQVWEFLQKYDQIKIILDGHTSSQGGLVTKTIERDCGSDVLAIMTDVSYAHSMQGAGGQFRLLEIDPGQPDQSSKVRGRLVYARTNENVPDYPVEYNFEQQAINTTHSDAYFIKDMNLSNTNAPNFLLFEDFNDGLPDDWHWSPADATNWRVDMTNKTDSWDHRWYSWLFGEAVNETDISTKMSIYGRVQDTGVTAHCNDGFLPGTYLVYDNADAKKNWSNYTFEIDLSAGDNDGIGVMFYYTDENNYYRFSMFKEAWCGQGAGYYSLENVFEDDQGNVKRVVLASGNNEGYAMHTPHKVVVNLSQSGNIKIDVFDSLSELSDDRFIVINKNDSTHTKGTIGLYSWGMDNKSGNQAGAIFDNVLVAKDTGGSTLSTVKINNPASNTTLRDSVTFEAEVSSKCEIVDEVFFSIREADGATDIPIGYEDLKAAFTSGKWELNFDTTELQDGHYALLAKARYESGKEGLSEVVPFSIRNWEVIQLLPASNAYRAGRTMPVKFSLRIDETVDSEQPFVYYEDLEVRVYEQTESEKILKQTSIYGDSSEDYRINSEAEHYITNFKTGREAAVYLVEIWRPNNNFLIGGFNFATFRK